MGCGQSVRTEEQLKKVQKLLLVEATKAETIQGELQTARQALLRNEKDAADRLRGDVNSAKAELDKIEEDRQKLAHSVKDGQKQASDFRAKIMNAEVAIKDLKVKLMKEKEYAGRLQDEYANLQMIKACDPALQPKKKIAKGKEGKKDKANCTEVDVVRTNLIIDHGNDMTVAALYHVEGDLGEGAFGTVRLARHKKSKETRAIKEIPACKQASMEREIALMKLMDHLNVIRLYETFIDQKTLYLVMEICDGGELFETLVQKDMFSESEAAITMQQLLRGVHHMHERKVIHRDLKPENLMLQGKGEIKDQVLKIIDLGLAIQFTPGVPLTSQCGTPVYMSPEQVLGGYDERCDLWACGCIMYILLSGCLPFDGDDEDEVFAKIIDGNFLFDPYYWSDVSQDAKQLCRWLLTYVPQGRCTSMCGLSHKWITKTAPQLMEPLSNNVLKNIRGNRQRNLLKKAALQVIALNMSKDKLQKLPEIFLSLDENQNGMLSSDELSAGLDKIDCGDADWLMGIMPADGSEISYTEFIAAAMDKALYMQRDVCRAAFQQFDRNGDGSITPDELKEVLGNKNDNGKTGTDAAIDSILLEVDKSGDGVIDFDEFMAMMCAVGRGSMEPGLEPPPSPPPPSKPHAPLPPSKASPPSAKALPPPAEPKAVKEKGGVKKKPK